MDHRRLRLGLVGIGKIVRDQHLAAIEQSGRFDLVATAAPEGQVEGASAYRSIEAMLAHETLDAVSICTPPGVRAAIAETALRAGLAVMVEKPPTATLSQAERLARLAASGGQTLFSAWHSRETAPVDAVRAMLTDRRIDAIEVIWHEDVREWHPGQDWLLAAGGFGVFDPAINALSILTKVLPGHLAVQSAALGVPENRSAPIRADVMMHFDGSVPVRLDLNMRHAGTARWDIIIATDRGTIELGRGGHRWSVDGEVMPVEQGQEYPRLYRRFAELVDTGRSDFDIGPLMLVADAMMVGHTTREAAFHF